MTRLEREWYNILQKDGFDDIECYRAEFQLKRWDSSYLWGKRCKKDLNLYYYKRDFYYYANHFAIEHIFDTEIQQFIWGMHAKAVSMRNIAELTNEHFKLRRKRKYSKDRTHAVIKKLRPTFLKYWARQDDDSIEDMLNYREAGD